MIALGGRKEHKKCNLVLKALDVGSFEGRKDRRNNFLSDIEGFELALQF